MNALDVLQFGLLVVIVGYVVLVAAIVVGLATTLLGAADGEEYNYRLSVSPWSRSLFVLGLTSPQ
jgi:nitrate reductase gamma subunit